MINDGKKKTKGYEGKLLLWLLVFGVLFSGVSFAGIETLSIIKRGNVTGIDSDYFILPSSDACFLRNDSFGTTFANCQNGSKAVTIFMSRAGQSELDGYFLYNISTFNKDYILGDSFSDLPRGCPSFALTSGSLITASIQTLNISDGRIWHENLIVNYNDTINASLFPSDIKIPYIPSKIIKIINGYHTDANENSGVFVCDVRNVVVKIGLNNLLTGFVPNNIYNPINDTVLLRMHDFGVPNNPVTFLNFTDKSLPLNYTLNTFIRWNITSRNSRYIYFDYESGILNVSNDSTAFNNPIGINTFPYDFGYDTGNNILKPFSATGSQRAYAGAESFFLPIPDDAIENTVCDNKIYSTDSITNLNELSYNKICFQLKDQHNQRNFFGVWMMTNSTCPNIFGCSGGLFQNTGRDITIELGFIAPGFISIDFIDYFPTTLFENDDVTVRSITNRNATGYVQYRYADINSNLSSESSFSTWFTNNDSIIPGNNSLLHQIKIIDVLEGKYYQFFVYGIDLNNNTATDNNNGLYYNFTVGIGITGIGTIVLPSNESVIPAVAKNLKNAGLCESTSVCVYMLSFIFILVFTAGGWILGGTIIGISTFTTFIFAFSSVGLLPTYLMIPIGLITALLVARFIISHFKESG